MAADKLKLSVFTVITGNSGLSENFGFTTVFKFPNPMYTEIYVHAYLVLFFAATINT